MRHLRYSRGCRNDGATHDAGQGARTLAGAGGFGGFYNANSAKLILSEVNREHGQAAVDQLIRELGLEKIFGFAPGTRFEGGLAKGP